MSSGRCVAAVVVALLSQACATTVVLHERDPLEVTARRPAAPAPPAQPPPPPPVVQLERNRIRVDEKIQFALNSADILSESHGLLDQIAQVINEHPEVGAIRVEGHTSSEGSRTHNQRLSQRRAQSVVAYLVGKGVPRERLQPQEIGRASCRERE